MSVTARDDLAEADVVSTAFCFDDVVLPEVEVVHAVHEVERADSDRFFPSALRRTNPPCVSWLLLRGTEGPFGPFSMAQTRITAMAGILKRLLVVSTVVDNADLADWLHRRLGIDCQAGAVKIARRADQITGSVDVAGTE